MITGYLPCAEDSAKGCRQLWSQKTFGYHTRQGFLTLAPVVLNADGILPYSPVAKLEWSEAPGSATYQSGDGEHDT